MKECYIFLLLLLFLLVLMKISCPEEATAGGNVEDPIPEVNSPTTKEYPLAVKMMFNYSVASDAEQIRSAMARETVPSQCCPVNAIANEK